MIFPYHLQNIPKTHSNWHQLMMLSCKNDKNEDIVRFNSLSAYLSNVIFQFDRLRLDLFALNFLIPPPRPNHYQLSERWIVKSREGFHPFSIFFFLLCHSRHNYSATRANPLSFHCIIDGGKLLHGKSREILSKWQSTSPFHFSNWIDGADALGMDERERAMLDGLWWHKRKLNLLSKDTCLINKLQHFIRVSNSACSSHREATSTCNSRTKKEKKNIEKIHSFFHPRSLDCFASCVMMLISVRLSWFSPSYARVFRAADGIE